MYFLDNDKLDFSDVLIVPRPSQVKSRAEVNLARAFRFLHSRQEWAGIPIMAANMDGVGTPAMAKALAQDFMFTAMAKSYDVNDFNGIPPESVAVSTGISDFDLSRMHEVLEAHPRMRFICIDVANGYGQAFVDCVKRVRTAYPEHTIIAGNVVTGEMTRILIEAGADIVKVGIGPGSVCTTRIQTGVGYPQLSAIIECARAAHEMRAHVIADGGCTCPGDIAKAFGAGADFVMLGGMLAGHKEGGGEKIVQFKKTGYVGIDGVELIDQEITVQFYGMSSTAAQEKHGGFKDYRSSEGRDVTIPYRGPVKATVNDILGGLRSACSYVGAFKLEQLPVWTVFARVHHQYNKVFA